MVWVYYSGRQGTVVGGVQVVMRAGDGVSEGASLRLTSLKVEVSMRSPRLEGCGSR